MQAGIGVERFALLSESFIDIQRTIFRLHSDNYRELNSENYI